ncbi:hypothetical protein HDV57DRAFT_489159 [Trichoderma longibrachiatum]|uniref:Uncharacterized protein n=1 Tax=Trichoderma longibrachiatum ATCC 18648 TaxID=983965 RepID=A0A2T4BXB4_TRILO|nr:hypothetical protein M440DRAFT_1404184 [Trichoderma longibrachiatum ATCC 18648]
MRDLQLTQKRPRYSLPHHFRNVIHEMIGVEVNGSCCRRYDPTDIWEGEYLSSHPPYRLTLSFFIIFSCEECVAATRCVYPKHSFPSSDQI